MFLKWKDYFSYLKSRGKKWMFQQKIGNRPAESTVFLSKDRHCGHSTRLSNFKVTNTRSGDRHSHPEDRLIFIQVAWFCDAAKKMSLKMKRSFWLTYFTATLTSFMTLPRIKLLGSIFTFHFWDALSFLGILEQNPRWCFVSQQKYLPFLPLSIRSAISLPCSLEVEMSLFLARADFREAMNLQHLSMEDIKSSTYLPTKTDSPKKVVGKNGQTETIFSSLKHEAKRQRTHVLHIATANQKSLHMQVCTHCGIWAWISIKRKSQIYTVN